MPVEITKRYLRIRVKDPKKFVRSSFRTQDVGRPGGTKRIAGRLKSTGDWATQSWIFELSAIRAGRESTLRTLRGVMLNLPASEKRKIERLMR